MITIGKNGILTETEWNEKKETFVTKEIKSGINEYLFDRVTFTNDLTLRDILLLIDQHLGVLEPILTNWVEEFIEEGLSDIKDEVCDDIDYLQIYQDCEEYEGELSGLAFPSLHGVSISEDINYSLMGLPVYSYVDKPIRLGDFEISIFGGETIYKNTAPEYSLINVLYAIVYEISFFGSPEMRDKKNKELVEAIDEIETIDFKASDFKKK